ncbi:hypothetical protein CHS0354_026280 [Potamilus streckersoni]|uniref:Uncharacterized protein n=1 Tax=Potamilus streckersoni TaxID=2493646 RepID=A0AAE0T372_9BIVA|nr:hypothetical protein CHS0354_026280 [Potamilus streckersoni]
MPGKIIRPRADYIIIWCSTANQVAKYLEINTLDGIGVKVDTYKAMNKKLTKARTYIFANCRRPHSPYSTECPYIAKHDHDHRNIIPPRTTTTTTSTSTNPSVLQTTKPAPIISTQTKLHDHGKKTTRSSDLIKRPAILPAPPRRTNITAATQDN